MTVGEGTGSDRGFRNFGTDTYGSLDDDDFTEGGNDIDVLGVIIASAVIFRLSRDLSDRDSYILEFAGEEIPLDEATTANVMNDGRLNLTWNSNWVASNAPSLNVSNFPIDARVPVCLRTAAQVCPAGASDDTTLSALELADSDGSAVALSPVFASGTSTYTASVVNAVGRVTVTPTTTDANATVDFLDGSDGARTDADTGTDGFQVDLDVGENVIRVKVTAEDGTAMQTYSVAVTRMAASGCPEVWCATLTVKNLGGVGVGRGCANSQSGNECTHNLTEDEFRHDDTDYALTSIAVQFNGDLNLWLAPDPSAAFLSLVLVVGSERFLVEDSDAVSHGNRTYRQWSSTGLSWSTGDTVELKLDTVSSDATLSAVELDDGKGNAVPLNRTFDPSVIRYTASVDSGVDELTVRATATHSNAMIVYRQGDDLIEDANAAAEGFQVELDPGENMFEVRGRAEDKSTKTYHFTVTRRINTAATGKPRIEGVPQVGKTLTAVTDDIEDVDGLPSLPLRWKRAGVLITTADTYTVSSSDVGHTITVEVEFVDQHGGQEGPLVSEAVGPVVAAAGACPADSDWSGTLTMGYESSASLEEFGFTSSPNFGGLDRTTIPHGSTEFTVTRVIRSVLKTGNTIDAEVLSFAVSGGTPPELPDGTVLNLDGREFTVDVDSATATAGREEWDLRDLGILFAWVGGQELTVCANLPPGLTSASVEGTSLVLTYDQDLDTGSEPAASAYSVTVNGTAAAPSEVSIDGKKVTLTLTAAVATTDTVTVSYTVPGSSPVRDESGVDALSLADQPVETEDTTAPELVDAEVPAEGDALHLTFDEDLDFEASHPLPPTSAFTVTVDGVGVTVTVLTALASDSLVLSVTPTITEGQTVTVSYDAPSAGAIRDASGNEAVDFADREVTNNSTVVDPRGGVLTPPALVVDEGATGSYTVVLTAAPTGRVTVRVGGATGTGLTPSPTSLEFTSSNWHVARTVSVTAGEDANAVDERVTLTHTVSQGGGYDGVLLPGLEVRVADNDGGLVAEPAALTVAEGGTATYGLRLTRAPTTEVTVTVMVMGAGGGVTADPSTLTFTADDWGTAQTVTVSVEQDGDKNDERVTLGHAAMGGGYAVAAGEARSAPVAVTVHDDEATEPGAPELEAKAGHETALLRWTAPADDGGAPVTGYRYRRGGSGAGEDTEGLGSHTVRGLENGTEYGFQVRAVNRIGEGTWSAAKTVTPVPLTLTVEAVSEEVVEGEPVRYRIRMSNRTPGALVESVYRHGGDFLSSPSVSVVRGISSRGGVLYWEVEYDTVDDAVVEADGSFTVTIQQPRPAGGVDLYGQGQGYAVGTPSSATVRILDNDGGSAPGAPSRPSVSVVSPTMVGASWGGAAANGAPVTGYVLEYRAGGSGSWTRWAAAIAPGVRSVRLRGLLPGTGYEVRVRARSVRGPGPWSATGSAATATDPGVTVSIEKQSRPSTFEGATLVFTVRAAPAAATALRVDVRVTETVSMLLGRVPTTVTVPAGQRSARLEVRTEDDGADEGYSEVTAELLPSVRYVLGEARATYRVQDDEPDTERGRVLRARVETVVDPRISPEFQALLEEPVRALRLAWEPPGDVALAHVRGWLVEWAHVAGCSAPRPAAGAWPGGGYWAVEGMEETELFYRPSRAMHFRVRALLVGSAPGPWSEPVCGDVAEFGSARGVGASETVVTGARIVTGSGGSDGVWSAGDEVSAEVRFSEAVTVDTTGGTPTLAIVLGDERREAVYSGGSGTRALVFRHEVGSEEAGARGARVVAGGLAAKGGTIRNAAGVDAELGFALAPVVRSVAVEPDGDGDGRWSVGEAVRLKVGFSDGVTVRTEEGRPSVTLLMGGGAREAAYVGGTGTGTLTFAYEVVATDGAVTSVLVPENGLGLNGGAIMGPTGLAAVLGHAGAGRAGTPARAAGVTPALSVADASAEEGGTLGFAVTLDRAAGGRVSVDWATTDGTAKAGEDYRASSGRLVFVPGERSKTVRVEVLVDEEAEGAETMGLTLSNASGAVLAGARATGRVSDGVQGPPAGPAPAVSIADARVEEGPGAVLGFAVTLDRASGARASVEWETRDGNARAGEDYVGGRGRLVFVPGERAKTIRVEVLDDSHDEGQEIMLVVLSNPVGATIAKASAGGLIDNTDHMPQAWLSRFGRTVSEQVLSAVEDRIRSAPRAGVRVTVAGQGMVGAQAADADALEEAEAKARLESLSAWLRGEPEGREQRRGFRPVAPRELLTRSSFAVTTGAEGTGGGVLSLWGRGGLTRFDGREGELSLSGELTGALLGADWTRASWTAGLMLSHARGEGSYREADSGKVSSTVTGLYPYGRYALTERVTVWGSAGYGVGALVLTPEDGERLETDMDLVMAAAGLRGTVVEAAAGGGPELSVKSDAMAVRTWSEAIGGGGGGNLAAAEAEVTRLRLGLEGTWRGLEIGRGALVPRLEVGVRHDGGDAETGFGLDLGGGLAWADPRSGIRAEASGRGLLTHEAGGFRQRGIAGRLGWDPTPGSDRGPSLTVSQTLGLSARGGADALLGRATLSGLEANDNGDELDRRRLEVKLGYGFGAFGDRFTSRPEFGFGMSAGQREYSLGWRLRRDRRGGDIGSLEFSLEARRRERANDDAEPEHGVGFRMTARF